MMRCIIDIDRCSIANFTIGETYAGHEGYKEYSNKGYSSFFDKGVMENFVVFTSSDYANLNANSNAYQGEIFFCGIAIDLIQDVSPENIKELFGDPVDSFQDHVELNMTFVLGKFLIEFSWCIEFKKTIMNYFATEISLN